MGFIELWKKSLLAYKSENIVITPRALWNEQNRNWKCHGHIQFCCGAQEEATYEIPTPGTTFSVHLFKAKILGL